jgi:uncharacterized FlaG/YvyC family protein
MTQLSPQAQAIWDTYIGGYSKLLMTPVEQFDTSMDEDIKKILAAVLRAAANQVIEEVSPVEELLNLAEELEQI